MTGGDPRGPILQLGDTAGVPTLLARGLTELGLDSICEVLSVPAAHDGELRKAFTVPQRLLAARRLVRRVRPSILHVHYATAATWHLDRSALVVHCHGSDVRGASGPRRGILDLVFRRSALTLYATPDLRPWVPRDAVYLPNPVDTDLFAPAVDPTPPSRDVLIFAAATEVKGVGRIVDIVRAVQAARPDTTFTTIDMGDQVDRIRRLGVEVVARRPQAELPELIRSHRLVIGQQLLPALGTAELQAMACGRAVVAVPSPDLYPDMPPVLTHATASGAAEAVVEILGDTAAMAARAERSREWVERHHGAAAVCATLAGLYRERGLLTDAG